MQMHRMRYTSQILNHPKRPLIRLRDLEHIVARREVHVALGEILERRFVPGDVHVLALDMPIHALHALPVLDGEIDIQTVARRGGERGRRGGAGDDGDQAGRVFASAIRRRCAAVSWESGGTGAIILEDGSWEPNPSDTAEAAGSSCDVEPVVTHGLVGINGDIVPLADGKEQV